MARPLELLSCLLPMTYAYDALSRVAASSTVTAAVWRDAVILIGATALSLALGAATLRRRTAMMRHPSIGMCPGWAATRTSHAPTAGNRPSSNPPSSATFV